MHGGVRWSFCHGFPTRKGPRDGTLDPLTGLLCFVPGADCVLYLQERIAPGRITPRRASSGQPQPSGEARSSPPYTGAACQFCVRWSTLDHPVCLYWNTHL